METLQDLCSFERFNAFWKHYGYGIDQQELIDLEFKRIKGITYLDHAGTTLFPESLIKGFYEDIARNVYGNPHSHNPSSRLTHDTVESVRYRILEHFNTTPEEYSVIFTSGCTAALKLVADSFPWKSASTDGPGSRFCYLTDNHTSVVGIRGAPALRGVTVVPIQPHEVEAIIKKSTDEEQRSSTPHLFCYPAQSNFSGRKYPLRYVKGIQSQQLYPACEHGGRWFVLLDAACFVSCSHLDLRKYPADFVPISFYKMFGFPTGLGALLVRNETAEILRKSYFGGGTAAAYLMEENYFVPRPNVDSRFEDGTISFLDIISLHHGFETLQKLTGSMLNIQLHTFGLARYTYTVLSCLCHSNGKPVAQIYCDNEFQNMAEQGAILNFSLLDCHGRTVGYSQVDKMASLFNIHIRTGCFCNTGACQYYLGISNQDVKTNLQAGHVCGDNIDLVEGRPTGSIRVSFGYMSSFEDCQNFLRFIVNCFVYKPLTLDQKRLGRLMTPAPVDPSASFHPTPVTNGQIGHENGQDINLSFREAPSEEHVSKEKKNNGSTHTLTNLFIYPVKSCASFEVAEWPLGPQGLLYDRLWMVVNENGVCLSQKREPKLCLIQPVICLASNTLQLKVSGMKPVTVPLDANIKYTSVRASHTKVCGDSVLSVDCGKEVSAWLSEFLGKPCRLLRQSPDVLREMKIGRQKAGDCCLAALSLVNEAQFLLINRASVSVLQQHIDNRQENESKDMRLDMEQLVQRFRANIVVSGQEPFVEEGWSHLTIGTTKFKVIGKCGRCQMIGVDQKSAARTQEPLRSLSECRSGKVTFGVYLTQQSIRSSTAVPILSVGAHVTPQVSESADNP
nr:molybdenum cofactor sulfurase isoform X1 [Misgurnus anguillicaudatus]